MHINEFLDRYRAGKKDFSGVNLSGAKFENAEFDNINLDWANLENTKIKGCRFCNSSLNSASFKGAIFDESTFINVDMQNVDFSGLVAVLLEFIQCKLNNSIFIDTDLGDVYFTATSLCGTNWTDSHWTGGITESDLTGASLDGLEVGHVELMRTVLPNGILSNQIWENIFIDKEEYSVDTSIEVNLPKYIQLNSDVRIDYSKLSELLSRQKWTHADRETAYLICKALGLNFPYVMIDTDKICHFSCKDLQTIDCLWNHFSWGYFGFSVQNQIWRGLSYEYRFNEQIYKQFYRLMAWEENRSFLDIDRCTNKETIKKFPKGCFPALGIWAYLYGVSFFGQDYVNEFTSMYSRIYYCQINSIDLFD